MGRVALPLPRRTTPNALHAGAVSTRRVHQGGVVVGCGGNTLLSVRGTTAHRGSVMR